MEFSYCACTSLRELSAILKHELSATLIDDVYATHVNMKFRLHETSTLPVGNMKFLQYLNL